MIPDAFFTFSYSESSFQEMLPDAYLDFETETKNTVFIFIFIFEKQKQKQPLKNVTGRALKLNDFIKLFPKLPFFSYLTHPSSKTKWCHII